MVGEDEPPENALKRFRYAAQNTGLVNEVGHLWSAFGLWVRGCKMLQAQQQAGGLMHFCIMLQARRRMYFENKQDEKKRRVKEGHMKKSK